MGGGEEPEPTNAQERAVYAFDFLAAARFDADWGLHGGTDLTGRPFGDAAERRDEAVTEVGALETRPVLEGPSGRMLDQVWVRRSTGAYTAITGGPYPARLVSGGRGEARVLRRGRVDTVKYRDRSIGAEAGALPRKLRLGLIWGQSLAQGHTDPGQEALPPWRGNVHERAWMFDSSAFDGLERGPRVLHVTPAAANHRIAADKGQFARLVPLRGATHAFDGKRAQTSAETMGLALMGQHLHWEDHLLACVVGTGETGIAKFIPGEPDTAHMRSMKMAIDAAKAWVDRVNANLSGRIELEVFDIQNQGEADNNLGVSRADYLASVRAVRAALESHVAARDGTYVGSFIQQTMHRPKGETGMATLAQAELIRGGEAVGLAVPPMRPGYSRNFVHLKPLTYLPLGCQAAYAVAAVLEDPGYKTPFVADGDAVIVDGAHILCRFSGGDGSAMVFDTDTIANTGDGCYGVTVSDSRGPLAQTAPPVWIGPDTLRISIADTGHGPVVSFGLSAEAQVNIRDSSAWPCAATGQVVSGWVIAHQVAAV